MKYLFFLVLSLVTFSNIIGQNDFKNKINRFEKLFGNRETENLNIAIKKFDSFLQQKYNSTKTHKNFRRYLKELSRSKTPDLWEMDLINCKDTSFRFSFNENYTAKKFLILPDTIYQEGTYVYVKYSQPLTRIDKINVYKKNGKYDFVSVINQQKKGFKLLMGKDRFDKILKSFSKQDMLVEDFFSLKKSEVKLTLQSIAERMLKQLKHGEEYFAKRIIVMEMNNKF